MPKGDYQVQRRARCEADARALWAQGLSDAAVASRLGISRRTVQRYRQDPGGSRSREYKRRSRRSRRKQGGGTRAKDISYERIERLVRDGLSAAEVGAILGCAGENVSARLKRRGTSVAALRALGPLPRRRRTRWTADEITSAMIRWTHEHGHPPTYAEWRHATADHPSRRTLQIRDAGGWPGALARAGLVPAGVPWAQIDRELQQTTQTVIEIADAHGIHQTTIYKHYRDQGTTVKAVRAAARRRAGERWGLLDYFA